MKFKKCRQVNVNWILLFVLMTQTAWALDPLVGKIKRDPTREIGVYRVELERSKQDQLDRFQRLLENSGSVKFVLPEEIMSKGNEPIRGQSR